MRQAVDEVGEGKQVLSRWSSFLIFCASLVISEYMGKFEINWKNLKFL